jgi:hypothetical protein
MLPLPRQPTTNRAATGDDRIHLRRSNSAESSPPTNRLEVSLGSPRDCGLDLSFLHGRLRTTTSILFWRAHRDCETVLCPTEIGSNLDSSRCVNQWDETAHTKE